MPTPRSSYVQRIQQVGRNEHIDENGHGYFERTFYVEPYTSHPWVMTALKGTISPPQGGGNQNWTRILPHSDPIYLDAAGNPLWFCTDAKCIPMNPKSITGCKSTGFEASNDLPTQATNITNALNNVDDFDFASIPDVMTVNETLNGEVDYNNNQPFTSKGNAGAYITATYSPLLLVPGLDSSILGTPAVFDYTNPVITPLTVSTQLGRSLGLLAPKIKWNPVAWALPQVWDDNPTDLFGGLSDSASVQEVVWEIRITRRLVPFLPQNALGALANKLNHAKFQIGSFNYAPGLVRMETPVITQGITPDGYRYWNIELIYIVRQTYDSEYNWKSVLKDSTGAAIPDGKSQQWVDWNHVLGVPALGGVPQAGVGYYQAGWFDTVFIAFGGNFRGPYLFDLDVTPLISTTIPNPTGQTNLVNAAFNSGFQSGQ